MLEFATLALVFGGATALKVESLIPHGGTLLEGLSAYKSELGNTAALGPIVAGGSAMISSLVGAGLASEYRRKAAEARPTRRKK
jgi:hypothetical protein